MCLLCAAALDGRDLARRAHVLQLLALIEDPGTLPADAALRLAQEILMLTRTDNSRLRCDRVLLAGTDIEDTADRRLS